MTKEQFIVLMDRLDLSTIDVADLAATSRRAVEKWRSGHHPVPQLAVLLLLALLEEKITFDWIGEKLEELTPTTPDQPPTKAAHRPEA
jgi:transcriptional regulator with XRE-family HTH domain